jgi:uncharacterized protein YecE (DUF72 family)
LDKLHVGTVGWGYNFWVGNFYPEGLKPTQFLSEYSKHFHSVEIDNTFYRIPNIAVVENWRDQTPSGFLFSTKFPRKVTQEKKLVGVEEETRVFLNRMSLLKEKEGPLLIQLSSDFTPEDLPRLRGFLDTLPKAHRFVVEVKNRKMLEDRLYSLLRDRGVALAIVDHPFMPKIDVLTAAFAYLRLEGDKRKIKGTTGKVERDRYADTKEWAGKIRKLLDDSTEVFVYVNKYYSGHSPTDAYALLDYLIKS